MICRLCSEHKEDMLDFFDSVGLEKKIVSIIAKHFWFEPKLDDKSHTICVPCWTTTKNFHELYMLVEKVEKYWTETLSSIKEDPSKSQEFDIQEIQPTLSERQDLKENYFGYGALMDKVHEGNLNAKVKGKLKKEGKDKRKIFKRTPEETYAFNKKIAEGDALIAKFMKIYCNVCSKEQINFTALKHHCTSNHAQQGVVMCCGRKFYKKCKLVEHIEMHIDPEKCHICNHISANHWNLKIHMESIHKEENDKIKAFKCSYCSKTFKLQAQLARHKLIHLPEEEKKFKCSYCKKNFPSESNLKYHIRLCHEGYYSGVCDICGKAYNNRQDLKRHRLQIHEGVGKSTHKCKYCCMEFGSKYAYNIHKFREHENQNPNIDFKCTICNKISANSEALKNHIQYVHRAKAKFECTLCKKSFKRELALKEHMAAHTGQSLYSCPHCSKTFTHSSNMHHHRKLKHPVEFELARKAKDNKKETWKEFTSLNM
ncbi:zinc finger protein 211-like isoform X2 [Condylostylus longicornis]|uniref:zinc finger protein 211-like isoform X2 n=1 Tax=Condylostylus longicornis TaxID=2530218 RepID=UPI00244E3E4C|nr:zinc finger protein 211-like isoform X2 [Condylostylus longicornis]